MRFGTFVPQGWKMDLAGIPAADQWSHMVEAARATEELGYHSLWVYDHFHTHPVVTQESTFEAWTLMAALAAATERIRLGQMCTCALHRSPSMLAKIAASVDAISGGRLDVGIGAGWNGKEMHAFGYDFPGVKERLDRLEESVQILIEMWTKDEASFSGVYYRVDGAINRPSPLQDPYPPLWIAGGGEKRTLKMVAQYGDYSNFSGDVETFLHKSAVLQQHCEDLGRDYAEIGRSAHVMAVIGRDDTDLAAKLETASTRRSATPEEFAAEHLAVTVNEAVDILGRYAEAGCSDMILYFYDMGARDSREVVATEVMPQLR